jgi:SAM-dependent methyltransferase
VSTKQIAILNGLQPGGGHCWIARAPAGTPPGDGIDDNDRSQVKLLEDGVPLGPLHSHHADIRSFGQGRFSHWGDSLLLSTSDNSDPRVNGRVYSVEIPDAESLVGRDPATIPEAADYAIGLAKGHLDTLRRHGIDPAGCRVLELGPGKNFGAAVLLACAGAKVTVADPYLSPWVDGYHHLFFKYAAEHWQGDTALIGTLLEKGSFDAVIRRLSQPAENLSDIADSSMDVVFSTSVLEHVLDLGFVAKELNRVSRPAAWHFHSIDLKDHQGYGKSLDHLLLSRPVYDESNRRVQGQRGCQTRASEFRAAFESGGFQIVNAIPNTIEDEAYFQDILARLRVSDSPYAPWPEDDLRVIEIALHLRKGS